MEIDPKQVIELSKRQVIIYLDEDANGYFAGCHSQGDTWEETLANIKEAIELWIADAIEYGEPIPEDHVRPIMV